LRRSKAASLPPSHRSSLFSWRPRLQPWVRPACLRARARRLPPRRMPVLMRAVANAPSMRIVPAVSPATSRAGRVSAGCPMSLRPASPTRVVPARHPSAPACLCWDRPAQSPARRPLIVQIPLRAASIPPVLRRSCSVCQRRAAMAVSSLPAQWKRRPTGSASPAGFSFRSVSLAERFRKTEAARWRGRWRAPLIGACRARRALSETAGRPAFRSAEAWVTRGWLVWVRRPVCPSRAARLPRSRATATAQRLATQLRVGVARLASTVSIMSARPFAGSSRVTREFWF
jgi:hypothetical protein